MLRQRRQQAPDSSSSPAPTPGTTSDQAPAKQAKGKATKSKNKSKTASSSSKMQDEPAAELRTLDGDGRDSTDGPAGSYRDAPDEATSPTSPSSPSPPALPVKTTWLQRNQWVALALASGACAAFNGVFAKLYVYRSHRFLPTRSPQTFTDPISLDPLQYHHRADYQPVQGRGSSHRSGFCRVRRRGCCSRCMFSPVSRPIGIASRALLFSLFCCWSRLFSSWLTYDLNARIV